MPRRRGVRRLALEVLFESELSSTDPSIVLARRAHGEEWEFAARLVRGVAECRGEIDDLLARHASGWRVERMPAVDRTLLRLGIYELLHEDVPVAVTINELVELAKTFSTAGSGSYVNGVLSAVAAAAKPG